MSMYPLIFCDIGHVTHRANLGRPDDVFEKDGKFFFFFFFFFFLYKFLATTGKL
jgi:hypothetical protein